MISMSTFLVSAFWHGFYPSYYFCFFFAMILAELNKDLYKAQVIFNFIPEILRPILANQAAFFAMNYMGIVFCATTWHNLTMFVSSTYAFMFISLFVLLGYTRGTNLVGRVTKGERKTN